MVRSSSDDSLIVIKSAVSAVGSQRTDQRSEGSNGRRDHEEVQVGGTMHRVGYVARQVWKACNIES